MYKMVIVNFISACLTWMYKQILPELLVKRNLPVPSALVNQEQNAASFARQVSVTEARLHAGCVLVTFKSRLSVPPYRIENKTSDVVVYFAQSTLTASREKWNWLVPKPGGSAMAYAWDEPTAFHRLQVQVWVASSSTS